MLSKTMNEVIDYGGLLVLRYHAERHMLDVIDDPEVRKMRKPSPALFHLMQRQAVAAPHEWEYDQPAGEWVRLSDGLRLS